MRNLHIDLNQPSHPLDRFFQHCVGAGRANEMLRAEALDQLSMLQSDCGFRYLRFHGLLCDDMAVYSERDGKPWYNWQYIDLVFDAMLDRNIRPLVELGFMPDALKSGEETIFWWRGNVTPPADMDKWAELIRRFVEHVTSRYGADEVRQWYFEVWNEPNLSGFWTGGQQKYFDLYDATAAVIKAIDPAYRVGGPATAGLPEGAWIEEMINHCIASGAPIDFISSHSYGVEGALDEFGRDVHTLCDDPDKVAGEVNHVCELVHGSKMPHLPVIFTEWSSSYTPRDNVHDSYVSAAFILHILRRVQGNVDSMSYWTFTDIFEEPGPPSSPFHGGFGLINTQGLKKPAYYAYQWLCQLPDEAYDTGDFDSYAARGEDGLHILLWQYAKPVQDDVNEKYFIRDLPAKQLEAAKITLNGLPDGQYQLTRQRTGYLANDVYTAFLKAGYTKLAGEETPTREQINALRQLTDGSPEAVLAFDVVDGKATLEVPMRENDVVNLVLRKLG